MTSLHALENLTAENAVDPLLCLLTIDHASLAEPIRLVADHVDCVSRGDTFIAYPFAISLPGDGDTGPIAPRLSLDAVSLDIVKAIRALTTAPSFTIEVVLGDDPDTVEESYAGILAADAGGDLFTIDITMSFARDEVEPTVQWYFTPSVAPGLYR